MQEIIKLEIWKFSLIYLLLIIVLIIMKVCKVKQTKLLILASIRMSVQLILVGYILAYIFKNPHPIFPILYFLVMTVFAICRVLLKNRGINKNFKIAIALGLFLSGASVLCFFIYVVVGESIFNAQYVIPIGGMIMGNAMTGVTLGVKAFRESFNGQKDRINALLNFGAEPKKILIPFVNQAIETALLPTLNSMLGMGIVALPGMMTGQILSGTIPTTAILYQIAIMIAICTVVCLSTFIALFFGYRSMYNKKKQINI